MAEDQIVINADTFTDRISRFYAAWKADKRSGSDAVFGGVGSIVVVAGKADPESSYQKNNALHFWLLGYEFPATLLLLTPEAFYVVTTAKKAKHLESLKDGKIPVDIFVVTKEPESKTKAFEKCLEIIKETGKKVGIVSGKKEPTGPFVDEWKKALADSFKDVQEVDVSQALSLAAFAVKDQNELLAVRTAARACTGLAAEYWVDEMATVLDSEKKISHTALAQKMEAKIDDTSFFSKLKKMPADFDTQQLEWSYGPIVQSGGKYDLKVTAQPDSDNLHSGTIIAGIGLRYKTYCAMIARTYLVDPSKSQLANYKILLAAHEAALAEIKDGALAKDVYNYALGVIRSKKPDLEKHFPKNVGAAIGIELRDGTFVLGGKNTKTLKDGMTLSVTTSLIDLTNDKPQDARGKNYSLMLTDTVRVAGRNEAVAVFTKGAPMEAESIEFYFRDEEDDPSPKKDKSKKAAASSVATSNIKSSRLRGADRKDNHKEEDDARRRENQKQLAERKQKEGLEKYTEATGNLNGTAQKQFKKFESYKRENQLPLRIKDVIVWVDTKASTVILPIMGRPVPFHINTIKSVSKSEEGEYTHLRFNFLSPGQGVGRKDDQPFEDANAHFVRSLTVRSKDTDRLGDVAAQITELRKSVSRREQEKKELEDVVEQEKLIEVRNRRPTKLGDVFIRPAQDGKRVAGEVEIHQNGVRYTSPMRNDHVDVVFSNVKHMFFQPCVGELIVILHLHLRNPIMIGKRKTKDVQFYREATDMAFDETGNRKRRHRFGDEEEFEAEQEERRRRAELDKQFKKYGELINEASKDVDIGVDVPFREMGFQGVPNRSNVLMQPTTDALVQLTEPPFTVLTIEEVEVAHLERIQFGLKNFDMVFVFKDFHRPPAHINTIPVENLERTKDWLDSIDIPYTEGPLNLNWPTIMKTVTADPHQFFVDGGWSFLRTDSDDEGGSDESEESAFQMSDAELAESEESSEDESDFDDDASADEGEDDSMDDEEGEDWDELEKKAKRADMNGLNQQEEERSSGGKKRKR